MPNRKLNVFLCHAKEDKPTVRELYRQLTAEGWMDVWLDEEKLLPGQNWDIEIEKAVESSDIVLVCLSQRAVTKEGYVQSEQSFVLDIARTKPEETIFVIPLRLDECQVPRRLRTWQYLDYFPKANRKKAYQRLLESLKLRAAKFGIDFQKTAPQFAPAEDETAKAERERKAREERERLAAQKAENERVAREKAEAERIAKIKRDSLAPIKIEGQTSTNEVARTNKNYIGEKNHPVATHIKMSKPVKQLFVIAGIIIMISICITVGSNYIFDALFTPVTPTPPVTGQPTRTLEALPTLTLSSTDSRVNTLAPSTEKPVGNESIFKVNSIAFELSTWSDLGHLDCPRVVASITVNTAGAVTFKWTRKDDPRGGEIQTITFDGPGTKNVRYDWTRGSAWAGTSTWVGVFVVTPNNQDFGYRSFTTACTIP